MRVDCHFAPARSTGYAARSVTEPLAAPTGTSRRLGELPFDARDGRAIDGTARWMGTLGRFQVLAGALLLLLAIGAVVAWTLAAVTAPEVASDTTPPLVQLGEVSTTELVIAVWVVALFGLLVLRGGVLLTDAAEDLEHHVHAQAEETPYLEDALDSLAKATFIDASLVAAATAGLAWVGSLA